jgi:hypothetical protein
MAMNERVREHLIGALKQALAESGEQRLYRSGKLAGLFSGRGGAAGDAAAEAVRSGLLEVTRTETRGKFTVEWVRLTPKGVEFLHQSEAPVSVLRELRAELLAARGEAPAWLEGVNKHLRESTRELAVQMEHALKRLDALAGRVEDALRRLDGMPTLPHGVATTVPWAPEAITYLDHRRDSGAPNGCPLPELFSAVRGRHPSLSLTDFQDGLRRLSEHKALRLARFEGPADRLPEPEYALLDGADVLYYATR